MPELAIIVPIYKPDFLREALESLANQTSKDFMAYICDDCSPHDLQSIVDEFVGRFPFKYIRFAQNLGSKDLVSNWERCLAQAQDEKWAWIFSDDDVIDSNCVSAFYKAKAQFPEQPLFHFDVTVIDSDGKPTTDKRYIKADFPSLLSAENYLRGRLTYRYNSFIVEYVFSRQHFADAGGFVHYDMAWGSDDATWYQLAKDKGICTINGDDVVLTESPHVRWRKSAANITPDHSSATMKRKLSATREHLRFCRNVLPHSTFIRLKYYLHALYNARTIGIGELIHDFTLYLYQL